MEYEFPIKQPPADPDIRLMTTHEIVRETGMNYDAALALCKVHGRKYGRYYMMTYAALRRALNPDLEGKSDA